ncbi:3-phosphoshikimate 1-carboxyvinyltransferase [SAR202 cluster bacterium AC-409-J13_OGT_754m]|nr:3-phosphoshikimate 1-carboxyvinyltransferase [SAR202 cluster bacterium AC-409-J13_OGT_754m]
MHQLVNRPKSLIGKVDVPGDKSIAHRALILNSLAKGISIVRGLPVGEDVKATELCLKDLGVRIEKVNSSGDLRIYGSEGALRKSLGNLDARNSGTTMRLLSGALASQSFTSVITGDYSLLSRPMDRIIKPLNLMGACVSGAMEDSLPPITIKGGDLHGIEYTLPVASAQVKSCIMLAALRASTPTIIHQPALSRDHTERMLDSMGAKVIRRGFQLEIFPGVLKSFDLSIPGDISAASFWMVAGICHANAQLKINNIGINPGRIGIIEALKSMGANLFLEKQHVEAGEPCADILIESSSLVGVEIGGDLIPRLIDEIPVLAVAACFAKGTTVIKDASELRVKESDRISTIVRELTKMGASIEERSDGMVIHGKGKLEGAEVGSYGDHRLAMALGVAGLVADNDTIIDGSDAVGVSYPQFWDQIDLFTKE